jgi:hypothetical protein
MAPIDLRPESPAIYLLSGTSETWSLVQVGRIDQEWRGSLLLAWHTRATSQGRIEVENAAASLLRPGGILLLRKIEIVIVIVRLWVFSTVYSGEASTWLGSSVATEVLALCSVALCQGFISKDEGIAGHKVGKIGIKVLNLQGVVLINVADVSHLIAV